MLEQGESGMTASEATVLFIRSQRHIISDGTLETYTHLLKRFIEFFGERKVENIETVDLREFRIFLHSLTTKTGKPYRSTTINSYMRTVKRLFSWLNQEGVINKNPARRLEFVREPEPKPTAIEFNSILALLEAATGNHKLRDEAILIFLFSTGCRVGELCGLKLSDIDWTHTAAYVTGKGNKSRWVTLDDIVVEALDRYILWARPDVDNDFVFQGQRGPLSTRGVWQRLRFLGKRAGIDMKNDRINPHSFRHAFVVHMLLNNVPDATVAKMVGHSDPKITGTIYAKYKTNQLAMAHKRHSPANLLRQNDLSHNSVLDRQLSNEIIKSHNNT